MINWRLYAYIGAAVAILLATGGSYLQGRKDGGRLVTAEYASRDLQEAHEAQIAYAGIVTRYRAKEQEWQKSFSAVSTDYQGKVRANEKALDIAIAGSRLFDRDAKPQACGSSTAETSTSASGGNAGGGSELSSYASGFLRSEASRADKIVLKLQACQAILASERAP